MINSVIEYLPTTTQHTVFLFLTYVTIIYFITRSPINVTGCLRVNAEICSLKPSEELNCSVRRFYIHGLYLFIYLFILCVLLSVLDYAAPTCGPAGSASQ